MKTTLAKGIPSWGALAVVALVLFASIVTGREASQSAESTASESQPPVRDSLSGSGADIDLEKLKRPANDEPIIDVFARHPTQASPATERAGPAAPPPLPFQYLGKLIDGDKTAFFVIRGDDHYSIEPGQTIDKDYRIERITDTAVTFIYLPLGIRQILQVPELN
jgi:hypothetical protein